MFDANKYFNDQEPWNQKDNKIRLNTIVYTTLEIVRKLELFIISNNSNSSLKALNIFGIKETKLNFQLFQKNEYLKHGQKINMIDILFKKDRKRKMIDSHCHLDHDPLYSDIKNIIKRSTDIGVKKF